MPEHDDLARYHRQTLLPAIGVDGQRRLGAARVLVVGCGALGSVIVDQLARAGVGTLRIVDRDVVEITNLQRQVLFTESDVEHGIPKAEAARLRVAAVNRLVAVEAHVDDFDHRNAGRLCDGVDVILDGLDNFETRYLLNDLAVRRGVPYVYGGAVGTTGMSLVVLPHAAHRTVATGGRIAWTDDQASPCLRCLFPDLPPAGSMPTCDTAGVLGPLVAQIASHQTIQTIKLLTGNLDAVERRMLSIDVWTNEHRLLDVSAARSASCPCCGQGRMEFLDGRGGSRTTSLCGRNAVQIVPPRSSPIDLPALAERLGAHGVFTCNAYLLRGVFSGEHGPDGVPVELTLFADGRAIVKGTTEPEAARSIYARYVGG